MAQIAFVNERMLRGFGVDLVIDAAATELAARGHDVTVYASAVDDPGPRRYRLERTPTRASRFPSRYESRARCWAGYIDAAGHDLVFVESFPFFSLIPRLSTPTVVVDHGVSPTTGMSLLQKGAFAYIRGSQQNRYFPRAAGIVTVSEFVRSLLPQRLASSARVIYNGVDHYLPATADERERMRRKLGVAGEQAMLLYVGRLNHRRQPYKGTADLMRAASRWRTEAPEVRVVMAGRGSDADAQAISRAGAIPLLDVAVEEMAALYAAADVYVTASRWEGFDLPLMESAYQGVPAVALRVGAHPELVRHGETGILASDIDELFGEARRLALDRPLVRKMGEQAQQHAIRFTWARAADSYEGVIEEHGRARSSAPLVVAQAATAGAGARSSVAAGEAPAGSQAALLAGETPASADVTAVILNYGATDEVLRKCVASVAGQSYALKVLLVDNASPRNREAVGAIESEFPDVRVLRLDRNYGFAGGMNRGVAAADTEYVLLLNNDVELEPEAVAEMRRVIDSDGDVVGVAPKILLESQPGVIDAIGNLIDPRGAAFNMGIGQLDVGQYDRVERTFGACFAAALLRRKAFDPGLVGPLDERYFMYYEDVDWCFRAGLLGFKFLTAPGAVVYHTHSLSTRELDYGFKYRLIMRNFVRTVLKDFSLRRALGICARRMLGLSRNVVRGPHRVASFLALKDIVLGFPAFLRARRCIQERRRVQDKDLFDFSHGERAFFDPMTYQPHRQLEVLEAMYRRLALLNGEERHLRIAEAVALLAGSRLRFDGKFARERLRRLMESEPAHVKDYLDRLEL